MLVLFFVLIWQEEEPQLSDGMLFFDGIFYETINRDPETRPSYYTKCNEITRSSFAYAF